MKDKRQRIAMAWPFGIADQEVYAYLMNAAAASLSQYPYAPPTALATTGSTPSVNYYASMGLQRAAASAYSPLSSVRPPAGPADVLPCLPTTYLRPSGPYESPASDQSATSSNGCPGSKTLVSSRDTRNMSGRQQPSAIGGHLTGLCPAIVTGEPCTCRYFIGSPLTHFSNTSLSSTPLQMTSPKIELNSTSALFQPYKTDAKTVQ